MKRNCAQQFGAETSAIAEGISAAELMRTMLLDAQFPDVRVTDSKGGCDHIMNPKTGLAEDRRSI